MRRRYWLMVAGVALLVAAVRAPIWPYTRPTVGHEWEHRPDPDHPGQTKLMVVGGYYEGTTLRVPLRDSDYLAPEAHRCGVSITSVRVIVANIGPDPFLAGGAAGGVIGVLGGFAWAYGRATKARRRPRRGLTCGA